MASLNYTKTINLKRLALLNVYKKPLCDISNLTQVSDLCSGAISKLGILETFREKSIEKIVTLRYERFRSVTRATLKNHLNSRNILVTLREIPVSYENHYENGFEFPETHFSQIFIASFPELFVFRDILGYFELFRVPEMICKKFD